MPITLDLAGMPLLVAGMHRSGTSLAASLLEACGWNPGLRMLDPSAHNPHGYHEDADLVSLQGRMLHRATREGQGGWPDWGFVEGQRFDRSGLDAFQDEALHLLRERARTSGLWGWKDPRTTLLLDFWLALLPTARFCFLYRDPWEVVQSAKRLGADALSRDPAVVLDIWRMYNQAVLDFQREHPAQCVLIGIQRLIETPAGFPDLLRSRWGVDLNPPPGWTDRVDAGLLEAPRHPDEIRVALRHPGIDETLTALHAVADWPGEVPVVRKSVADRPAISVIIPCRNDGVFLAEAVASVERIRNVSYEIILVDDGSDQLESLSILEEFRARGHRLLSQAPQGLAAARNYGIRMARGDYILPLDADNRVHANYLIQACRILDEQTGVDVVYANPRKFGVHSALERMPDHSAARLLAGNFIDACALFRRRLWETLGGFDEHIPAPSGYEDWDFWLAATAAGARFSHLDEFLFDYRERPHSLSAACNIPENRERLVRYLYHKHRGLMELHAVEAMVFQQTMSAHRVQDHQIAQAAAREAVDALQRDYARQQAEQIRHWTDKLDRVHDRTDRLEALLLDGKKREQSLVSRLVGMQQTLTWRLRSYFYHLRSQVRSAGHSDGKPRPLLSQVRNLASVRTWQGGRRVIAQLLRLFYLWAEPRRVRILEIKPPDPAEPSEYMRWWQAQQPGPGQQAAMQQELLKWEQPPLISILMPVYNSPPEFLRAAIDSLRKQIYPHWELCIADDASTRGDTLAVLREAESADSRIRLVVRRENGHISRCSNDALKLARGEFCALMDHDDVLAEEALYEVARECRAHPELDLIYTDEDKIDESGRHFDPHFKPDWCPENLLTRNYLGHLTVIRTALLREVDGFREGFEGSQDYDLYLRLTERTDRIAHIPKVLYGWRVSAQSVAGNSEAKPYAYAAAQAALQDALRRRGEDGRVEMISLAFYDIRRPIRSPARVSLILPTGLRAGILDQCLLRIFKRTAHRDFEVIAVDSSGGDSRIHDCLRDWAARKGAQMTLLPAAEGSSLAHLINCGGFEARGEFLVLFQPHLEILHTDWMTRLLEEAQRPAIGVVGCHVIDGQERFRHCGMILGRGPDGVDFPWRGISSVFPGHLNMLTVVSMFSAVSTDCCMFRKSVFQEAQGFDEALPDDLCGPDFCLRSGARGYRHVCHPRVRVLEHPDQGTHGFVGGLHPDRRRVSAGRELFRNRHALPRRDPCVSSHLIHPSFPGA